MCDRRGSRAFLIYGYAKSNKEDLDPAELAEYKSAATDLLGLTDQAIVRLLADGKLVELEPDGKTPEE